VTTAQLYQKLKAKGVRGLIAPSGNSVKPMTDGYCIYGTAYALQGGNCPAYHWNRNGYTNPQIYYHDMSSSAWPEGTVISTWNNSPKIHVAWAPSGCPGYSGTHCVPVFSGNYGASGWDGQTYVPVDSSNAFIEGASGVAIDFNDYYGNGYSYNQHLSVACHETGHSFGMDHNVSTNSCLYYIPTSGSTTPDSDDYSLIANILYP
jgi:hypothetical protein